jgi:hypothetical protein
MKPCVLVCLSFLSLVPLQASAQGESAVPFLLIHPSSSSNGMGSVSAAIVADDPIATIMNPAQLGMFGLQNYFSLSTYSPKTQWLPSFGLSDLAYDVLALNAGYDLSRVVELPYSTSGFGIRIGGVWKLLQALSPEVAESEVWAFFTNHFDFGYDHAEYKTEATHPLSDTKFNSITVILR